MDDGNRSRNWMLDSAPEIRPEPRRLLAPLLTVAVALATPLVVSVPVAVVLILAALAWLGSRIQEGRTTPVRPRGTQNRLCGRTAFARSTSV
ncbi:hypothetical protein [Prescottella equi]|uniref:hypothetical protein n=1 Tax=Rhodococcus hoagii TaxID=43767 RepID=UPI001C764CCE|nr:hypothetical protein [Prescottella equi]BCN60611.1 hypothetical protein RE9427_39810 [Prescottella equi]